MGLFGRRIGDTASMAVTTGFLMLSAVLSWVVFSQWTWGGLEPFTGDLRAVHPGGQFRLQLVVPAGRPSAVMLVVVTTVSALVHLYSWGYMAEDRQQAAVLRLPVALHLLHAGPGDRRRLHAAVLRLGRGGLASYLLIGFWYHKPTANAAAIKAFVVNRIGDFGFALGIMTVFWAFGSIQFAEVFPQMAANAGRAWASPDRPSGWRPGLRALFIGAMGKSAQFFLHTWLPDAMEGPTPVSALIHAATMVTAGVYMVCLLSPMFEYAPTAKQVVIIIGALTALFAATVGLAQNDIKRVIAYSTCSQLGYMFFAAGVGAYQAGDVPPLHPRLLQGPAVPGRGQR